ncbi:MAG: DUF4263 domain-containing protein, partial [Xanthomonadales bacterium]|nr:DUF4263 domain-containing protein [Xanthomonadales bacterium]
KMNWGGRYIELITEDENQFFGVTELASSTLYETRGGKQKIQATVLQTDGLVKVPVIYVSRINVKTGTVATSGEQQMCLYPEVAEKLYQLIGKLKSVDFSNPSGFRISPEELNKLPSNIIGEEDSYLSALRQSPNRANIIETLINEGSITSKDIINTSYRRKELNKFKELIETEDYWKKYAEENNLSTNSEEKVWQVFFEKNEWIFGYGLDYRYKSILQREANISENDISGANTVISDYLLGDKKFTTFVEIKKPSTPLFAGGQNRSNSWRLSNELIYSVSQILEQKASGLIKLEKPQYDSSGNLINQKAYDSKVILIIGTWKQLNQSINNYEIEIKKKTLELFRNDSRNIELLTFDELYDRANFIVNGKADD